MFVPATSSPMSSSLSTLDTSSSPWLSTTNICARERRRGRQLVGAPKSEERCSRRRARLEVEKRATHAQVGDALEAHEAQLDRLVALGLLLVEDELLRRLGRRVKVGRRRVDEEADRLWRVSEVRGEGLEAESAELDGLLQLRARAKRGSAREVPVRLAAYEQERHSERAAHRDLEQELLVGVRLEPLVAAAAQRVLERVVGRLVQAVHLALVDLRVERGLRA